MIDFIAFDTETTGFFAGTDQIVEIGAVKFVGGAPHSTFVTLVNPRRSIPIESSRVNGIVDDMVKDQPFIETILEPFVEFCGNLPLVAHNASFDYQFLMADLKKYEISGPQGGLFDTLQMAKKVFPGLLNYKLGTLVQHLGIPSTGFHRAQEDAGYCGHLFINILSKIQLRPDQPMESLLQLVGNQFLKFPVIVKQPKQLDFLAGF